MTINNVPVRKIISENLVQLMRANRGVHTLELVAAKAGVSVSTVSRIIRKDVAPSVDALEKIAHAFDLDTYQLLICDLNPVLPQKASGPIGILRTSNDYDVLNSPELTQWIAKKPHTNAA